MNAKTQLNENITKYFERAAKNLADGVDLHWWNDAGEFTKVTKARVSHAIQAQLIQMVADEEHPEVDDYASAAIAWSKTTFTLRFQNSYTTSSYIDPFQVAIAKVEEEERLSFARKVLCEAGIEIFG